MAACGGSSNATDQTSTSSADSGAKLAAQSVPQVGKVLVNASGMTVYAAEQETAGHIVCVGPCTTIWLPVTVPAGSHPVAGTDVSAHLATIKRPDGATQVTAGGDPLYTFSQDTSPGVAGGNGFEDAFNAQSFTWHALTPSGAPVAQSSSPTPVPSNSGSAPSYGGYNY
jgi:predicted lipoprotein with Yx(FWY)xxD motif